jgi:hypothetical protein
MPSDFTASLHKQVGPLPIGGWILVVGAGVGFAYWRKRNTPTTTNTPATDMMPMTDQTIGNLGGLISMLNQGNTGHEMQTIGDNTSWYQQAVRTLIGRGNSPDLVDTALRKFMQGMPLSAQETAIKELALQLVGPIPSPPPPPTTEPGTGQPRDLSKYKVNPSLTPVNVQHLSDYDLINALNLTSPDNPGDPMWQDVVSSVYGTDDPLVYMNEVARRYQSGTIPSGALTGPVGPWTSGQPAWQLTWADINNRLTDLAERQPNRVSWEV